MKLGQCSTQDAFVKKCRTWLFGPEVSRRMEQVLKPRQAKAAASTRAPAVFR